jgi:hypothetical protein
LTAAVAMLTSLLHWGLSLSPVGAALHEIRRFEAASQIDTTMMSAGTTERPYCCSHPLLNGGNSNDASRGQM